MIGLLVFQARRTAMRRKVQRHNAVVRLRPVGEQRPAPYLSPAFEERKAAAPVSQLYYSNSNSYDCSIQPGTDLRSPTRAAVQPMTTSYSTLPSVHDPATRPPPPPSYFDQDAHVAHAAATSHGAVPRAAAFSLIDAPPHDESRHFLAFRTLDEFRHFFATRRPAQPPLQPLCPGQLLLEGGASYGGGAALPTPFATPKVQFSGVTPNTTLRFGGASASTTAAPPTAAPPTAAAPAATAAQQTPSSFPADGDDAHSIRGLGRMRASLLDSLRAERSKLERERAMLGRM